MLQERIDGETRKETDRYDQPYSCNPAPSKDLFSTNSHNYGYMQI